MNSNSLFFICKGPNSDKLKTGGKKTMKDERKKYLIDYERKHIDVIRIRVQKPAGAAIRKAAADSEESLQGYIIDAVHTRMKKEGKPLSIDEGEQEPEKEKEG